MNDDNRGQEKDRENVPELKVVPDNGAFDPYEFRNEDSGYSPDKFYTKSRDKNGGEVIRGRLSGSVLRDIEELVAEKIIPEYRTTQDVIRDAVYHRLKYIAEQKNVGKIKRRLTMEMVLVRRLQRMEELKFLQQGLISTNETLQEASHAGHWDLVSETIADCWDDIDSIPEPFKAKTVELLRSYGEQVKQHRK